jgi:hypothetical protein
LLENENKQGSGTGLERMDMEFAGRGGFAESDQAIFLGTLVRSNNYQLDRERVHSTR